MKKIFLFSILFLNACIPTTVAPPTMTFTESPTSPLTFTKTPTLIPTGTLIPTATLEMIDGGWSTFYTSEYGFSFQYPAVYDEGFDDLTIPPRFCNIRTEQKDGELHIKVGFIQITIEETSQSLREYVNEQIAKYWPDGWQVSSKQITAGKTLGIRLDSIDYNMTRWVATSYFKNSNYVIAIQHHENSFMGCDPKGINYSLYWVYEQIVNTLKFYK